VDAVVRTPAELKSESKTEIPVKVELGSIGRRGHRMRMRRGNNQIEIAANFDRAEVFNFSAIATDREEVSS
jgi:hypothetical protein